VFARERRIYEFTGGKFAPERVFYFQVFVHSG
jgi:hypothetical protein